jgi:multiple sugar transport system permease protein
MLLIGPALAYLILVLGYPLLMAFHLSLTDATTADAGKFVGLRNFGDVLRNGTFRQALANTFVFAVVGGIAEFMLAAPLAFLLLKQFRGSQVIRGLVLLPWIIPFPLGVMAWRWLLDPNYSVLNWTLMHLGILKAPITWLGSPLGARASIIMIYAWRDFPFTGLVLLAGLTSIPDEVIEAAKLEGAGFLARLWWIIIPLVKPIILVAILFSFVQAFTSFSAVYLLTKGGPIDSTHVIATLAFDIGIRSGDLGRGAAIAVFMFPLLAVQVAVMLRFLRSD